MNNESIAKNYAEALLELATKANARTDWAAVINGVALEAGTQKTIKLRDKAVAVRCKVVHDDAVLVEVNSSPLTLNRGEETLIR